MRRTLPATICASARSIASGFHFPDSFKSEDADVRKPWAVIWSLGKPMRRKAALIVFSLSGLSRVLTDGNT